jgi:hypothetical protein
MLCDPETSATGSGKALWTDRRSLFPRRRARRACAGGRPFPHRLFWRSPARDDRTCQRHADLGRLRADDRDARRGLRHECPKRATRSAPRNSPFSSCPRCWACATTPDEARQFQVGAASYILKSADALPDAYKPVSSKTRQMLRRPSGTGAGDQRRSAGCAGRDCAGTTAERLHPSDRAAPKADRYAATRGAPRAPAVARPASAPPSRTTGTRCAARDHRAGRWPRSIPGNGHAPSRSPGRRPAHRGGRGFTRFLG